MQLSVIIVNYNVKYFLEQCLSSVKKAIELGLGGDSYAMVQVVSGNAPVLAAGQAEVLVVDNNSTDGSIEYLQHRFPFVRFIANNENTGFAKANNLALAQARGKYVLFLNPDTILPEDCFLKCLAFLELHPDAGALGVRMVDGSGDYLPESKRGFPSPWVSFCKMSGLTQLFSHSRLFARYYLGHLSPTAIHKVDVLSGAFMWVRKAVLDKTGGFDERFFMYAEDIDLSYRIQKEGYENYYFPDTTIIHFKGESTRRDTGYIKLFYTAMIQFVEKHFKGTAAWGYILLLKGMIWLKTRGKKTDEPQVPHLQNRQFTFEGDEESFLELEMYQEEKDLSAPRTRVYILCEGITCTFKEIIGMLQKHPARITYIHALNTQSAVGSTNKRAQGNNIVL